MANNKFPIYLSNKNNTARFYLGTSGKKVLVFCGLNPSTATKEKSDRTITKVFNYSKKYGYDSFLMINLYPLRSKYPYKLPTNFSKSLHLENIKYISDGLKNYINPDLLVCWGNNISIREYLHNCLYEIWEKLNYSFNHIYQLEN